MSFFDSVEVAPPDPILGLNTAFKNDARREKVNLGVGAYKTAELKSLVLRSVKEAEKQMLLKERFKEYLPIEGDYNFLAATKKLVFGEGSSLIKEEKIAALQSVGGTGALSVGARFMKKWGGNQVYIPDPTWGNHPWIFKEAGFKVSSYPYYDPIRRQFDFYAMKEAVKLMPKGSLLLLHAVCHNPTGFDLSKENWEELALIVKERSLLPFFDIAYQGFGDGLEKDAFAVRHFAKLGIEMVVAASYSKNFGLYADRIGSLFFVGRSKQSASAVQTQVKRVIRGLYSNPPQHGAQIISTILQDEALCSMWKNELETMRLRIVEMRKSLVSLLAAKAPKKSYEFILKQKGMFSYTGLGPSEVDALMADYGIYLTKDGRMNIAGLTTTNLDYVTDGFVAV